MLEILRKKLAALLEQRAAALATMDAVIDAAAGESRDLTPDETTRHEGAVAEIKDIDTQVDDIERQIADLEAIAARRREAPQFVKPSSKDVTRDDLRHMTPDQVVDAVTRSVEAREIDPTHARKIMKRHADEHVESGNGLMRYADLLFVRSSDVYVSGFKKMMTGRELSLTAEERVALAVGTGTQGGLLVPTHLDPTLIITNTGSSNAIRPLARVVTLVRENTWNGVTTAGVTMSWDAELAEVSDDTPSVAAASIPTYQGAGFVQASVQAFDDIEGLASDVLALFADARDRLEGAAHAQGSGSGQPTGIFTAITGSNRVTSTTAATIGLVDLTAVKRALGIRFRNRATWVSNPTWTDAVRALGSAMGASYSVDITGSNTDRLLGRPVVETDDAPSTATTTALDPEIMFGDFSNYVIVDKPGSTSVEFIPHLFNTSNNLPDGRRGWYMRFRSGADSVNDAAFRVLVDKTSA